MGPSKSHSYRPATAEERDGAGGGIHGGLSTTTGQSRASKKRAKKKKQHNINNKTTTGKEGSGAVQLAGGSRHEDGVDDGPTPSARRDGDAGEKKVMSLEEKTSLENRKQKKRPRNAEPTVDINSSDEDPGNDERDNDHDEEDDVDAADFFDADAARKVRFRNGPNDEEDGCGADDSLKNAPPVLPKKSSPGTLAATTLPPPSVTRITQLLHPNPPSDDRISEGSDEDVVPAADGDGDGTATTPSAWLSRLTMEQRANGLLNFLLQPSSVTTDEFYATYWEKKPLLVQAADKGHRRRFSGLMGLTMIQDVTNQQSQLRHPLYYSRDLNVTKYEKVDGSYRRRTFDPAHPNASSQKAVSSPDDAAQDPDRYFVRIDHDQLWDEFYNRLGCTVRLLCPHKHFPNVHAVLSLLEHEFGNMVGANAYLTPPSGSQGFAPHYDDIEAFCCQLEGHKRWKVYAPLVPAERLPRTSSRDYVPSDLRDVEPVLDVVLSPGDVLYMPRGWIHQACTLPAKSGLSTDTDGHGHSLHLTISTMQQWAWVDLIENLMSDAVESLANSDRTTLLREGLPRNFVSYMGVVHDHSDESMPESLKKRPYEVNDDDPDELARLQNIQSSRESFRHEAKRRIAKVAQEAMNLLDASCDQMAKRFLSDRLPPARLARDADVRLEPDDFCRLARPGIARLVLEGGKAVLYHCADNSLVFHENSLSPLEFEMDDAPALEQLVTTVEPRWIGVQDLYHDTVEDKVAVAQALYDEGILEVRSMRM